MSDSSGTHRCIKGAINSKKLEQIKIDVQNLPAHLNIYTMNMSGIKSKVYKINDKLSQQHFHVYAIQETWLNESVSSDEIIGNTQYSIVRNDRAHFRANRKNGGGVMCLIHNSIKYAEIEILIKTILEVQMVEIIIAPVPILLINFYVAPNRARNVQSQEFSRIIKPINHRG